MCIEYTYSWPTFNGALVAEMSPNSVFWSLFFKIFLGGMPPDPPSFSMLRMLGVLCIPAPSKGPLFLEKNLPTLSSAYGPVLAMQGWNLAKVVIAIKFEVPGIAVNYHNIIVMLCSNKIQHFYKGHDFWRSSGTFMSYINDRMVVTMK